MFLSDNELKAAIEDGKLIFEPKPDTIDPTSIDLHLDKIEEVRIWDIEGFTEHEQNSGRDRPELRIAKYKLGKFSNPYSIPPPEHFDGCTFPVCRRNKQIIVRHGGFLLWTTKEVVGTPEEGAELICFVDGKSTKARAGIVVHLTAPTIHSSWSGNITLEIANLGPFDLVLQEDDVIAQLTVARITSPPSRTMAKTSVTYGQTGVDGNR